jgi:hypothetical protein
MRIIVTDLTRFNRKDLVCLAGLTEDGQHCIRPMRAAKPGYVEFASCKKLNVLPGTILDGDFTMPHHIAPPHVETRNFTQLKVVGTATSDQFEAVLDKTSSMSIMDGLGCETRPTDKVLTVPPARSIMTLKMDPRDFHVVQSTQGKEEKIKAHLTDADGLSLRYLGITDLGFFDNVGCAATRKISADEITEFIHAQDVLMIRLGLSQPYSSPDGRSGFWMQVNGIYTFPEFDKLVRSY